MILISSSLDHAESFDIFTNQRNVFRIQLLWSRFRRETLDGYHSPILYNYHYNLTLLFIVIVFISQECSRIPSSLSDHS